jgi:hypothetical protein
MEYTYSKDYGTERAYQAVYDKQVTKGLMQNMKEDKLSFAKLRAKLQREAWPDCKQDQAWWCAAFADTGYEIIEGESPVFQERGKPETAKSLAEYWFHVLKGA